jgi:hypothetical protein
LRFRQAATTTAKLATAAVLPRCHRHATTVYKFKKM